MTYGGALAQSLFYQREAAMLENEASQLQNAVYMNHTKIANTEASAVHYQAGSPQLRELHAQITNFRHIEAYLQRQLSIVTKKMTYAENAEKDWMERAKKYLERMSNMLS